MKIERNLIIPGKLKYIRGDKPEVECILCAVRDRDQRVTCLEVARNELMIVSLNLYPYNPGHLMVFPLRHLADIRQFSDEEALQMHRTLRQAMDALEKVYRPLGFNIGYNLGQAGGASLEHVHCHVVPRYRNEIGMVEMVSGGSRVLVEDPAVTLEKLRAAFPGSPE